MRVDLPWFKYLAGGAGAADFAGTAVLPVEVYVPQTCRTRRKEAVIVSSPAVLAFHWRI